ncbi:ribonuclease MC [Lathyrus oleraceus]|uniref:ribonuclease MC n=1 Tax=Pisum sativum TaxID=3888 RepID=UPI0021CFEF85|nr:ribonuclease MC-like [Pisum sativum]
MRFIFFIFVIFTIQFECSRAYYEYFNMVQQWPVTLCMFRIKGCAVKALPNKFTIHGLWGTNVSAPYPKDCTNEILSPITYGKFLSQIQNEWPDIENGNDKGFVETEWLKHGTCSLNKFTQIEYLQLALDIKNSISLIDVLKNANIVPHKTATYDISDIVRAIKTSHPNEPTLMCKMDPNPRNVIPYLQEIRLCFEDNGITPRNCPGNTRIMCINKNSNNKVFFPA